MTRRSPGRILFQLIFDTYHDKQNGFIFNWHHPVGMQHDAQVRNEGEQQSTVHRRWAARVAVRAVA